jgi:predicted transposase YbfD/YdcC
VIMRDNQRGRSCGCSEQLARHRQQALDLLQQGHEMRSGRKRSRELRDYISSLPNDPARILHAVRGHWGIENGLYGVLEMAFPEDQRRLRQGAGPEHWAVLRHLAVSLLKPEQTEKMGVKAKRWRAAVDEAYLLKVLTG